MKGSWPKIPLKLVEGHGKSKKRFFINSWNEVTRFAKIPLDSELRFGETFRELEPGNGSIMIAKHH